MRAPLPPNSPTVLVQRWVGVTPAGVTYYAGVSYHLTVADRDAMAQGVADRLNTDLASEREEPFGDAVELQVTPALYERIRTTPLGLRAR